MSQNVPPLNEYEEEKIYEGFFESAVWSYQARNKDLTPEQVKRALYEFYRELNGLPEPPRYFGFCRESELPIKKGDKVVIKKGTIIKNVHHGDQPAGRTYTITVDHVLPGQDAHRMYHDTNKYGFTNPRIVWPGKGGYWSSVDINEVL